MTGRELVAGSRLRPQPRLSTGDIERHFSVRHQRRHGHRIQHLTRHTAEDPFLQSGMPVSSHDEHVEIFVGSERQDRGSDLRSCAGRSTSLIGSVRA